MKNHQLRAFVALAEGGSLVKAATRLNKTAAAISKTIRELEDTFKTTLFDRTPYGMSLTAGGRILLPRAHAILAEMVRADEELRTYRGELQERLRIGVTPIVSVLIAPKVIERLIAVMPHIRLEMSEYQKDQISYRLDDGTLDIALISVPSFMTRPVGPLGVLLYSTEFALAVRSDSVLKEARSLADLQSALWIYTDPSGAQEAFIAREFRDANLTPPCRALLSTAAGLGIALALSTNAVVLIARPIADSHPPLSIVPLLSRPPTLDVHSLVRPSAKSSNAVHEFLEVVRSSLTD